MTISHNIFLFNMPNLENFIFSYSYIIFIMKINEKKD